MSREFVMDNCFHNIWQVNHTKTDSYTIFQAHNYKTSDEVVYSDRLHQWDDKKYSYATSEAFNGYKGQYFDSFTPNQIQNFLSIYFNRDVILTRVDREENVSNGYPYWVFYFRDKGLDDNE